MIRIADLTHYVAGPFATQLLAEIGADVIKVERPDGGDPWRRGAEGADPSCSFDFLNRRKRSVTLDLNAPADRRRLLDLVAASDAVVENFRPGVLSRLGLSFRTLRRANPRIVLTSISNFGQHGPRRDWQASELTLQALSGFMHGTGWEDGTPQQVGSGGAVAQHIAGLNAAVATLASIVGVRAGAERGVHNDVAIQEAFTAHGARHLSVWAYAGIGLPRADRGPGPQGFPSLVDAADGYLYVLALRAEWEFFAHFLGLDAFVTHEWSDPEVRRARWGEIDPHYRAAMASRGRYEWFQDGAEHGFTFAPVDDVRTVLGSPQLEAREFFEPVDLSDGGSAFGPRLPFRSDFEPPSAPNRAPRLGEHNDAVLGPGDGSR